MNRGSIVLDLSDLHTACSTVNFRDWEVEIDECAPELFRVRWTFLERDNMRPEDQALHRQTCRWWLIERYSSFSSVYKTLYLAAQQGVIHEFQEQFTVYGRPLLDPHAEVLA